MTWAQNLALQLPAVLAAALAGLWLLRRRPAPLRYALGIPPWALSDHRPRAGVGPTPEELRVYHTATRRDALEQVTVPKGGCGPCGSTSTTPCHRYGRLWAVRVDIDYKLQERGVRPGHRQLLARAWLGLARREQSAGGRTILTELVASNPDLEAPEAAARGAAVVRSARRRICTAAAARCATSCSSTSISIGGSNSTVCRWSVTCGLELGGQRCLQELAGCL